MLRSLADRWRRLPNRTKTKLVSGTVVTLLVLIAALNYMANSDGLELIDPDDPGDTYIWVFVLIALDAVMPIFPGETTLNAAATAAANGKLELWPIIVMGALGAIVGDSTLFWLARKFSRRIEPQVERAKANSQVRQALRSEVQRSGTDHRWPLRARHALRGERDHGTSDIPYRRFLLWSVISGILWSTYTKRARVPGRVGPR